VTVTVVFPVRSAFDFAITFRPHFG
jgi:hypothetical protein